MVVVCIVDVTPPTDVDVASVVEVVAGVVVVVGGVVVVVEQPHGACVIDGYVTDGYVVDEPCADAGTASPNSAALATPTTTNTP